jgi:hypothetical protein
MLALLVIVLASLAGVVLGGRLSGLAYLRLRGVVLAVAGFVALAVLQLGPQALRRGVLHAGLLAGSYALIVAFLVVNRHLAAVRLAAVGIALNIAVIVLNGGMPVSAAAAARAGLPDPRAGKDLLGGKHVLAGRHTRLRPLGDVIPIPVPGFRQTISGGDLVVLAGIAWLVFGAVHPRQSESDARALAE